MLENENNIRLSKVFDDVMVQFPIVARKIKMATKSKKTPFSSAVQIRILSGLMAGPTKPSDISYIHCISKPNVTTLINRLIDNGYAQRSHDEKDRRVVYVSITEKGKKAVARYQAVVKKYLLKVFNQIEEGQMLDVYESMEKFQQLLIKMNSVI